MNKFLKEFKDRGYFYQCTSETDLSNLLDKEKIKAYIGFDCTAESLHVGSLLQLMLLKWLQKTGNKPIVLLGGGTTKIGDPSGKDSTRKILSSNEINSNSINKEIIVREKEKILNSNLGDSSEHDYCLMKFSVKLRDLPRRQIFNLLEINYIATLLKDYCENGTKISENYEGLEVAIRKLKSESNSKVFPARNENGCIFGISDDELRSRITYKLFKDFEVLKSNEEDETAYQYLCNYRSKKFQ